jgi:hypothetical protein
MRRLSATAENRRQIKIKRYNSFRRSRRVKHRFIIVW